ncbi:hypothetical protein PsorP6_013944 [Peronosclerospora sorghi]|uniref:Uncharacterized protein n=1 Tax=Peronosclerospora sorghi TaxID=230839 RepID=A0ACC0VIY8_9STRA|nr:hypothetical protein PsorP6_013944 [Peronosclerospora sorghi]
MAFASSTAASSDLNGWYPCYEFTFSDEGTPNNKTAECATIRLPLCYPGICETHENASTKTVDIFVKRLVATSGNPTTASNVWLLQGGPVSFYSVMIPFFTRTVLSLCIRFSLFKVESDMVPLYQKLKGAVNVYTMDHRGTGRSSRLDCVAAQATTTAVPLFSDSEALSCAQDLQFQYDDFSSFSVTTFPSADELLSNDTNSVVSTSEAIAYVPTNKRKKEQQVSNQSTKVLKSETGEAIRRWKKMTSFTPPQLLRPNISTEDRR